MSGSTNSNSTEAKIDALFDLLYAGPGGPAVPSRMRLAPDPSPTTYFVAPERPAPSREDMERISKSGMLSELSRLLEDVPEDVREKAVALIGEIAEELGRTDAPDDEAPPELVYAMH